MDKRLNNANTSHLSGLTAAIVIAIVSSLLGALVTVGSTMDVVGQITTRPGEPASAAVMIAAATAQLPK